MNGAIMAAMSGNQIKERLERDLGFEANRARLLTELAASTEIGTYWERKGLPIFDEKVYTSLAKSALVAGLAGRQKLSDQIFKLVMDVPKKIDLTEVVIEISALVLEHQKTLNLSRNRASCVNAHLNVLEPERSLPQTYSPFLSPDDLKSYTSESKSLLKRNVASSMDFSKWVKDVHELLSSVSAGDATGDNEEDLFESVSKKGLISRKAISTYFKQWELFALEKLGPSFSIEVKENDASPLTGRLNALEGGASRTWTTMLEDITDVRTSANFQKRVSSVTEHVTTTAVIKNLLSYDLELNGRPLKLQLSSSTSPEMVFQFMKAMKAQFVVYGGKGQFNVSFQTGNAMITASLSNATKSDLKKIEEILLELQ
jgi:hypothetical protein